MTSSIISSGSVVKTSIGSLVFAEIKRKFELFERKPSSKSSKKPRLFEGDTLYRRIDENIR